ncbi:FAD-binding oxidoreductase [Silanimonas lenta]|uniref:FAD-binding oxidoreductase n=1 Tax=Silanimonas lenta TaxID=265429 RepID=UPI00042070E3|nr:FAD-binding oxidoreductase [Silanimonas lenta]
MDWLDALPETRVLRAPDIPGEYTRDESHVRGPLPRAVVRPRSPAALRALVRRAGEEGFTLVPRGAGSGKAGGCVPTPGSVVVDLSDWPGTIAVSPENLSLSAPASAPLARVREAADAVGLWYPPDPNSWPLCSFGGTLATNAGGPNACKYGMTRRWVRWVDALMADGEIHRFGIDSVKQNTGPSLAQLLVGSEGVFGLILGAGVGLLPRPREFLTVLLPLPDMALLPGLPARLSAAGLLPSAMEFWDAAVLADLRAHGPEDARRLPGEALVLLEFDDAGCSHAGFVEHLLEALGEAAANAEVATTGPQREALWALRRLTSVHLKQRFPNKVSEDVVVPRARLPEFFARLAESGLPAVSYGHLGDGNLHVNLLHAGELEGEALEAALEPLFALCLELGGALSGEHGIGLAKRAAFLRHADPYTIATLRALKQALDPRGIFNAGKVF